MKLASLPTNLGIQLIGDLIQARLTNANYVKEAVCAFQRMALVSDLDDSIKAMDFWCKIECRKWSETERAKLAICHEIVKKDVLGIAIESLVDLSVNSAAAKDRLAASTILNELYGEKQLIETGSFTDRLLVNIGKH